MLQPLTLINRFFFFRKSNQSCLRFLVYTEKSNRAILGVLGLPNFNEISMCELLSMLLSNFTYFSLRRLISNSILFKWYRTASLFEKATWRSRFTSLSFLVNRWYSSFSCRNLSIFFSRDLLAAI